MLRPSNAHLNTNPLQFMSPSDIDHGIYLKDLNAREEAWQLLHDEGDASAAAQVAAIQQDQNAATQAQRNLGILFA
jgi:hypothetical protein